MNGSSAQPTLAIPATPRATAPARPGDGHGHQHRRRDPGLQRAAVQLVERMRGQADGEEERDQRGQQAGKADLRGERGADDHVGQVPGRVRRMQQRPPVPPSARARRVVGGPGGGADLAGAAAGRHRRGGSGSGRLAASPSATCAGSPHHQAAAEAHHPDADVVEPRLAPRLDRPGHRVPAVMPGDVRAEEAADLEPFPAAGEPGPRRAAAAACTATTRPARTATAGPGTPGWRPRRPA